MKKFTLFILLFLFLFNHIFAQKEGIKFTQQNWNQVIIQAAKEDKIIFIDAYTDVYNDYFLKRYATALIKMQWGINLSKFEGMVMPGGVTFNGRQILEDAKEEIKELTEEARLVWEDPIDFITG